MSKCISGHGEYTSHVISLDGEHCEWCGELDMDAHDRAVKAEALREAADAGRKIWSPMSCPWAGFLDDRAEQIEGVTE